MQQRKQCECHERHERRFAAPHRNRAIFPRTCRLLAFPRKHDDPNVSRLSARCDTFRRACHDASAKRAGRWKDPHDGRRNAGSTSTRRRNCYTASSTNGSATRTLSRRWRIASVTTAARHGRYISRTNAYVVAFTFIRSAVVMAIAAWFWIVTDWPSGGLAVIGAALACALTSTSPKPSKMAAADGRRRRIRDDDRLLFTCHVYPDIDGFPLLCTMLAPVLALGAFIATRKRRGRIRHRLFGVLLPACRARQRRHVRAGSADQQRRLR